MCAGIETIYIEVMIQENGIIRLPTGRLIGRLIEDDEVNFEKLSAKAKQCTENFEKALNLACADAADDCCPHEHDLYECEACNNCTHFEEICVDTQRDIECWKQYYLNKARKSKE
jgi:hypothetical protein